MAEILKPHSEEWFKAMEKQNPAQAVQTRQIIVLAGTNNVCSVCGDEDSKDYKAESGEAEVGTLITLRLCDDCLNIRNHMHGEIRAVQSLKRSLCHSRLPIRLPE